jgi:outer membrane lipoprotein SlyB
MKKTTLTLLFLGLLGVTGVRAETVIEAVPDTLPGNSVGGASGFMAGAVAGPVGALVGAGIGWLAADATQQASGLGGRAYRVAREDGSERIVRSPGRAWSPGERVRIVGNRLVAASQLPQSVPTVTSLGQP